METIDTVDGSQVEAGDRIRVEGQEFEVRSVNDLGDTIMVVGIPLDDVDDLADFEILPDERVEILGFAYEED